MRKGVEPVIGAILIVMVGISLTTIAYYTYSSLTKEIISMQERQIIGEIEIAGSKIRIERIGYCNIYLRNVGTSDIRLSYLGIYVDNKPLKIPETQITLKRNEGIIINITRDILSKPKADLSVSLRGRTMDIGKIICPIPINGTLKSACDANETCVIAFSDINNSHVEDCSIGNYNYKLCANDLSNVTLTPSDCLGGGVVALSSDTNAQVEKYNLPTGFTTKKNLCIDSLLGEVECTYDTKDNCLDNYYGLLFSISGPTNAHVGDVDAYQRVVCCRIT